MTCRPPMPFTTGSVNFRAGKCVPQSFSSEPPSKKAGPRKKKTVQVNTEDDQHQAFIRVAEWFRENEDEQTTIPDLVDKMAELMSSNKDAYSEKYTRTKFVDLFGQDIHNYYRSKQQAECRHLEVHS